MNANDSVNCLRSRDLISEDLATSLQKILPSLSSSKSDLYRLITASEVIHEEIPIDPLDDIPRLIDLRSHKGDKIPFGINTLEGGRTETWIGEEGQAVQIEPDSQFTTRFAFDGTPFLEMDGIDDSMQIGVYGGRKVYTILVRSRANDAFIQGYSSFCDLDAGAISDRWALLEANGQQMHFNPPPLVVRVNGLELSQPTASFMENGANVSDWTVFTIDTGDRDLPGVMRELGRREGSYLYAEIIAFVLYDGIPTIEQIETVENYHRTLAPVFDEDAQDYFNRLEAVSSMSYSRKIAVNDFIVGLKEDGQWSKIKTMCLMRGSANLAGALVPIAVPIPTNFSFVSGDYDIDSGLIGDGLTKYLDTNRPNNADPQNDNHVSVYITEGGEFSISGANLQGRHIYDGYPSVGEMWISDNCAEQATPDDTGIPTEGFVGISRNVSFAFDFRRNGVTNQMFANSTAHLSDTMKIFSRDGQPYTGRIAFYSLGEAVDLELLNQRVQTLMDAL